MDGQKSNDAIHQSSSITSTSTGFSIIRPNAAHSLLNRNQIRLKAFKEYYEHFLQIQSFNQPISKQTMTYACHWKCNGWGDRLRGLMSVYVLALITRRHFMIDMTFPCSIRTALEPNLINWTYVDPSSVRNEKKRKRSKLILDSMTFRSNDSVTKIKNLIADDDFVSLWKPYDDILFYTNGYYITPALRNHYVNASAFIGRLHQRFATQQRLFPFLFELLFRPTESVIERIDQLLKIPHKQLLCLHMRLGENPTNPFDDEFPFRREMPRKMIEFLRQRQDLIESKETLIFVTSDSDEAIHLVEKEFPGKTVTIPGRVMHVDHFLSRKNLTVPLDERCDGFIKAIADFYLLGECDVSILSQSGFSHWATRRKYNPNENVFVFNDATGAIETLKL